jgi:hypothetical protein
MQDLEQSDCAPGLPLESESRLVFPLFPEWHAEISNPVNESTHGTYAGEEAIQVQTLLRSRLMGKGDSAFRDPPGNRQARLSFSWWSVARRVAAPGHAAARKLLA